MIIPVILAGGSGTRLWPLSRTLYPKQLLALIDEHTMLQHTLLRLRGLDDIVDPIVICNVNHWFASSAQLSEIDVRPSAAILEPVGKNTAPAVTAGAMAALEIDSSAILLVLPADHLIKDIDSFHEVVNTGRLIASGGHLVTFGIVPDRPETGFGYIRKGERLDSMPTDAGPGREAFVIREFVEKPDLKTARRYVESGEYCWNSGMFMFRAETILSELSRFAGDIVSACEMARKKGRKEEDAFLLDPDTFSACRADSIDYAVMEKTDHGVMIPFDGGWNDIGSWAAMWDVGNKDENGNVILGDVVVRDTKNSLVFAKNRLVSVIGLENAVVIETGDSVLVSARNQAQDVRAVAESLKAAGRAEAVSRPSTYYSWGKIDVAAVMEDLTVRRVLISPGRSVGLNVPAGRTLNWQVTAGSLVFEGDEQELCVKKNDTVKIDPKTVLTIKNRGDAPLVIVEIFTPDSGPEHFC